LLRNKSTGIKKRRDTRAAVRRLLAAIAGRRMRGRRHLCGERSVARANRQGQLAPSCQQLTKKNTKKKGWRLCLQIIFQPLEELNGLLGLNGVVKVDAAEKFGERALVFGEIKAEAPDQVLLGWRQLFVRGPVQQHAQLVAARW
jgi:hypothetical protein